MAKIFLIGFMGSGKTTLGKPLADLLNYEFIDLDKEMEEKEDSTIPQIFALKGEDYFREKESNYLKSFHYPQDAVVATGGGAPSFFDNMKWMNENGITVYIRVTPGELFKRLKNESHLRPLLQGKNENELFDFISKRLEEREIFYQQSQIIFPADLATPSSLYKIIGANLLQ